MLNVVGSEKEKINEKVQVTWENHKSKEAPLKTRSKTYL